MKFTWTLCTSHLGLHGGFPGGTVVRNSPASAGDVKKCEFIPWVRKIPWRRAWQSTPVFLPGKSHRQSRLAGCCPWGLKGSDMTEWLSMHARASSSYVPLWLTWATVEELDEQCARPSNYFYTLRLFSPTKNFRCLNINWVWEPLGGFTKQDSLELSLGKE